MKRIKDETAGVGAALAAVYALGVMLWRLADGEAGAVFDQQIAVAGVAALWLLIVRYVVTPLSRPRDREGRELRPAQQPPNYHGEYT